MLVASNLHSNIVFRFVYLRCHRNVNVSVGKLRDIVERHDADSTAAMSLGSELPRLVAAANETSASILLHAV